MEFKKLDDTTYVCDEGHVRFFLLIGEKEALMIDSGMQVTNAKELAEKIERGEIKAQRAEMFGNVIDEYDIGIDILLCDVK